ncbi:MAG: FliM/FliN family flagellar motor switch protein [Planctomycetes bacterium]|nr:FliM/FliN family flagellar motor switch protein [Planctomycetota bacterium]
MNRPRDTEKNVEETEEPSPVEPTAGLPGLAGRSPARGWRPHDFTRPRHISEERLRALDSIHRKFARSASAALSVLARSRAQVDLAGISQRSYFEFIRSLHSPTCLFLVYCLPPRVPLVLEIMPAVLFPVMERLLGGRGEETPVPSRPLTRLEQDVARSVALKLLGELKDAWPGAEELRFDVAESEHNPLLMQVVGPGEPAIVIAFQVALGTRARTGLFQLCLPAKPFESHLSRMTQALVPGGAPERNTPEERERILARLSGTRVEVSASLADVPVALSDLLTLRPGDVIDTQVSRASEIAVRVGGRRVFTGHPAQREGRKAVKITRCEGGE